MIIYNINSKSSTRIIIWLVWWTRATVRRHRGAKPGLACLAATRYLMRRSRWWTASQIDRRSLHTTTSTLARSASWRPHSNKRNSRISNEVPNRPNNWIIKSLKRTNWHCLRSSKRIRFKAILDSKWMDKEKAWTESRSPKWHSTSWDPLRSSRDNLRGRKRHASHEKVWLSKKRR